MGGSPVCHLGGDGLRTRPADSGESQQEAHQELDLVRLKLLGAELEGIRMTPACVTDRRCDLQGAPADSTPPPAVNPIEDMLSTGSRKDGPASAKGLKRPEPNLYFARAGNSRVLTSVTE